MAISSSTERQLMLILLFLDSSKYDVLASIADIIGRGPWPFIVQFRDHIKETT